MLRSLTITGLVLNRTIWLPLVLSRDIGPSAGGAMLSSSSPTSGRIVRKSRSICRRLRHCDHDFPDLISQQAMEILDAGRTYNGGKPPATISSNDGKVNIANIWATRPAQTILGSEQKSGSLIAFGNLKRRGRYG